MNLMTHMAKMVHKLRRLVRYAAVSAVSSTLSLVVLGALVTTRALPAGWANVVATAAGTAPSFELNRRWVWGRSGRRSILTEIGPFCAMTFLGLALSTIAVGFASALAASSGFSTGMRTFAIEAANVAAWGSIWIGQFFVLDRVLFADDSQPSPTESTPDSELHRSVSSA
jgi:putative flippase GtrA